MIWPVDKNKHQISQGFSPSHNGTDFKPIKRGEINDVYAPDNGVVVGAGRGSYFNWTDPRDGMVKRVSNTFIRIDHGNKIYSESLHLSRIDVKAGQRVIKGQVIGKTGMEGAATGVHDHFGILANGVWVDPMSYLDESVHQSNNPTQTNMSNITLQPWQTTVKKGIYISNVIRELMDADLGAWRSFASPNDIAATAMFAELNKSLYHNASGGYTTPQGFFQPGMVVNWRTPDPVITPEVVNQTVQNQTQELQKALDDANKVITEQKTQIDQLQEKPVTINLPQLTEVPSTPINQLPEEPKQPENPTPPEVIEMAKNPGITFDVKDIQVEPWQREMVLAETRPLIARIGELWKKVPSNLGRVILVIVSVLLPSLISHINGLHPQAVTFTIPLLDLTITLTEALVGAGLSLLIGGLSLAKKKDDEYLIKNYVQSK